jgi:tetratricopeptide (TPR) repeat protein
VKPVARCIFSLIACTSLSIAQQQPAVAQNSPHSQALNQAASLLRKAEFPAAIEAYREILKITPHDERATLGLAAAYRGIFNYEETRRLLRDAVKHHTGSGLALVELGKLDIHLQHYDEAVDHLSQAVRRQPRLSAAHEQLGVAYQAKGEDEEALRQFDEAIRLNPNSASAHYFRASWHADREDYKQAYKDALEAHQLESNPQSDALLGKAATHVGKCDESIALLKPLAEQESSDPANLYLLSAAYKCAGQTDLAQATLSDFESRSKKAQETRTQSMEADHLAAQAGELARKNQLAPAIELTRQALARDPDNAPTHAVLAKIEFSRGNVTQANEEISRALKKDPYNPDYLFVSGKVLEKQSDVSRALEAFQRTVLVNPRESDAYYEMAMIYLQQGKRDQAIQALKKAVQLSPDDEDYKKALTETEGHAHRQQSSGCNPCESEH